MQSVLTLIGGTEEGLPAERIAAAGAAIREAGGRTGAPEWLAPEQACDLPFEGCDEAAAELAARARLARARIDLAAQPAAGRRKRLLIADMESTIITGEMLDELGRRAGLEERIAAITARAMRGEIDFAQSVRDRVALLAGLPISILEEVKSRISLTPGARTLVQTMRTHGAYTALVSGGFDLFAEPVREACGFHEAQANQLAIADGRLTGEPLEPILDRAAKRVKLEALAAALDLPPAAIAAVGDGANDIPMLQAAGLGVAFHGKPAVAAAARFRLDHADLTGLLYLQGYRRTEFQQ